MVPTPKVKIQLYDIYYLVIKHTSIHVFLGFFVSYGYGLENLDVTTMFLSGEIEEEKFMQQPEGL